MQTEKLYSVVTTDTLCHHGIRGMHWGIRRYQNEDGSLTEEGRRHLEVTESDLKNTRNAVSELSKMAGNAAKIIRNTPVKNETTKHERLDLDGMTDTELRAKINRELLERQYNDVFNPKPPPKVNRGREIALNVLDVGGGVLTVGASALSIALAMKQLGV